MSSHPSLHPASAHAIREAMEAVQRTRQVCARDAALADALRAVKSLQTQRFAATYADLLQAPGTAPVARFFLEELYGERDFSERDAQFSRIAGTLERLFPEPVVQTAVELAHLHAITESLDLAMAQAWVAARAEAAGPQGEALRYLHSWRSVGRRADRERQLATVQSIGHALARLTHMPGLRTLLRMMRTPARTAGLAALQGFLEAGFDTFGTLARQRAAVDSFLGTIASREAALMQQWFDGDLADGAKALGELLACAPAPRSTDLP